MDTKLERVLNIFTQINNIPRKSKNEKAISDWLVKWAESNNFKVERDEFLDVLIKVPATPGYEHRDSVAFQGHMDMVCEKIPESDHDFAKDPIKMYIDNGWLKAENTSLGADNGIALALSMALVTDPDVKHPPIELLFTVDEETGLTGAVNLKSNWLESKKMINVDSEDDGVFTIGCAGGRDAKIYLDGVEIEKSNFTDSIKISVGNLKGGHSGVDIHKEKGNANIIIARLLKEIIKNGIDFGISDIKGGSAHNAIPRNCYTTIALNRDSLERCKTIISELFGKIKDEFRAVDPDMTLSLETVIYSEKIVIFHPNKIIDLILSLPHGVIYNSNQIAGVVETSCNLATVSLEDGKFRVFMSQRSSVASRMDELCNKIDSIVTLSRGKVEFGGGYPGWEPNFNSSILNEFKDSYKKVFNKEPVIEVIHAGLECGVIGAKYPGMDMISVGPTIKHPHSPDEMMEIETVKNIWDLLVEYLAN